jgi:hypothetical protein
MLKLTIKIYLYWLLHVSAHPDQPQGAYAAVARCTALNTHTTAYNTCCHNTATLITMYFYWLILQKNNFSKVQRKLPEDGPDGPKHVGTNIEIF